MNYSLKKIIFTFASTLLLTDLSISYAIAQDFHVANRSVKTFTLNLSPPCSQVTSTYCRRSASPVIENGIIYVRAFDEYIYAIDQQTGEISKKYNTDQLSFFEPAIRDGILYASSWFMYAFDQPTTNIKWKTGWAIDSAPAIYNGSVIFGERDGVRAIDRWTGKEKWKIKYDNEYFSSPLIHNSSVFVGSYSPSSMYKTGFFSIDAETGNEKWVFRAGYNYYAKPCAIDNMIYVGSADNHFYAINQDTGRYKWSFSTNESVFTHFTTSPYCDVDKVYAGSNGSDITNKLYAFDSKTGNIVWTFKPSANNSNLSHGIMSSPNVHNNVIFFGNDDHYLYAIYKDTGKLKWMFEADAEIRSTPVIDKGIVYFTTLAGTLYAVDEASGLVQNTV